MYGGAQPSNSLWVGNNYSSGGYYPQAPRNNYPNINQNNTLPTLMQNQVQPQPINNILQVMGPESAQAYQLGPDSQVILMDSNKPVFYMKKSDSSGYSETRAFEFKEIPLIPTNENFNKTQISKSQEYITKSEFEEFKKMIEELVMKDE